MLHVARLTDRSGRYYLADLARAARPGPRGRGAGRRVVHGPRPAGALDGCRRRRPGAGGPGRRRRPGGRAGGPAALGAAAARAAPGPGGRLRPDVHRAQVGERPVRAGPAGRGRRGGGGPRGGGGGRHGLRGPPRRGRAARGGGGPPARAGGRGGGGVLHPRGQPRPRPPPPHPRGGGQPGPRRGRPVVGDGRPGPLRPRRRRRPSLRGAAPPRPRRAPGRGLAPGRRWAPRGGGHRARGGRHLLLPAGGDPGPPGRAGPRPPRPGGGATLRPGGPGGVGRHPRPEGSRPRPGGPGPPLGRPRRRLRPGRRHAAGHARRGAPAAGAPWWTSTGSGRSWRRPRRAGSPGGTRSPPGPAPWARGQRRRTWSGAATGWPGGPTRSGWGSRAAAPAESPCARHLLAALGPAPGLAGAARGLAGGGRGRGPLPRRAGA